MCVFCVGKKRVPTNSLCSVVWIERREEGGGEGNGGSIVMGVHRNTQNTSQYTMSGRVANHLVVGYLDIQTMRKECSRW